MARSNPDFESEDLEDEEIEITAPGDVDLLREDELPSEEISPEEEEPSDDPLLDCMEDVLDELRGLRSDLKDALGR